MADGGAQCTVHSAQDQPQQLQVAAQPHSASQLRLSTRAGMTVSTRLSAMCTLVAGCMSAGLPGGVYGLPLGLPGGRATDALSDNPFTTVLKILKVHGPDGEVPNHTTYELSLQLDPARARNIYTIL